MNKKKLTVAQVVDAIEQNGYKQAYGTMYDMPNGAACAMGQAGLNLGVSGYALSDELQTFTGLMLPNGETMDLAGFIVSRNDHYHAKPATIAQRIRMYFPEILDHTLEVRIDDDQESFAQRFERVSPKSNHKVA